MHCEVHLPTFFCPHAPEHIWLWLLPFAQLACSNTSHPMKSERLWESCTGIENLRVLHRHWNQKWELTTSQVYRGQVSTNTELDKVAQKVFWINFKSTLSRLCLWLCYLRSGNLVWDTEPTFWTRSPEPGSGLIAPSHSERSAGNSGLHHPWPSSHD